MNLWFGLIFVLCTTGLTKAEDLDGDVTDNIYYGRNVPKKLFPFIASLQKMVYARKLYSDPKPICGAAIITPNYLVTAAHCFLNRKWKKDKYLIKVGTRRCGSTKENKNFEVTEIMEHPDYTCVTDRNDIALVKVNEPFQFTDKVKPVNLPIFPDFEPTGTVAIIGWGKTEEEQSQNDLLNYGLVQISDLEDCTNKWNSEGEEVRRDVGPNDICVIEPINGTATCHGDSGGPLIQRLGYTVENPDDPSNAIQKSSYFLIGVTSFGPIPCGVRTDLPQVFTRVSPYIEWIQENSDYIPVLDNLPETARQMKSLQVDAPISDESE